MALINSSRRFIIGNTLFAAIKRQQRTGSMMNAATSSKVHCRLRALVPPASGNSSTIKSVIFDFDGIMVDSETIFYKANCKLLEGFGAEYTMELKHKQMGRKLTEGVDCILEHTGLAKKGVVDRQEYIRQYEEMMETELPKCPVMPGVRKLVEHLQKHKIQMAICTGSDTPEFQKKIANCKDLVDMMETVVLAGDDPEVEKGKPAPDPYQVTMRRMRPPPSDPCRVLVFEDSINGVLSAMAAGCRVVWIPQEQFMMAGWEKEEEALKKKELFAEKLGSLEEFRPEKYGLPPFN